MTAPATEPSKSGSPALLAIGALIAAAHIANLFWWNTAFERGTSQAERVAIYQEGLPAILGGMSTSGLTWLQTAVALLGVLLALPAIRHGRRPLAIAGWLVAAVNGLFALWYLFTLM